MITFRDPYNLFTGSAPLGYTVVSTLPTNDPLQTPFWDGRIAPGFGSSSKTTIDLDKLRATTLATIEALCEMYDQLEVKNVR